MEFQFFGANCVRVTTKKVSIVIDDNLAELGLKSVTKPGDVALYTMAHGSPGAAVKITIDQPGEYEVSDTSVKGIAARAHIDEPGKQNSTMFQIVGEDIRVAVLGHVYPDLTNDQLEALGMVDVLLVPVGGNGYTLDPVGALKLIKAIEPKIVIPTHYADNSINYPVPQQPLEEALKALGMEPRETVSKLKVKAGELSESTQVIVLERQ
jgi:L-ascorbate metabolism protein UlaG (beta-lactamase superfamily)